jgi:citrate synthase
MEGPKIEPGLEGVYFTESSICKVDGTAGRLYYRGYPIEQLAEQSSFEEVCYLLLYGGLPTKQQFKDFSKSLASERQLPREILSTIRNEAGRESTMHTLRTAVSSLAAYDSEADDITPEAEIRKSIRLIAKMPSIAAAIWRLRNGQRYVRPRRSLTHAENLLYMLVGEKADSEKSKLLDTMLILHAEHSSNASTFSGITTASTLSDMYSAITSAIGTLKGPLHGGADEMSLRMMHEIGEPGNTEAYITDALAGKKKIMGFGHRVYKTYDPRARIIRRHLETILASGNEELQKLAAIAFRAEKMMIEKLGESHGIWPNVDFFSGPVYLYIGIPPELFTTLFAVSRVPGWCAHIYEYGQHNRLIRPLEHYNGPIDLEYVPIGRRK